MLLFYIQNEREDSMSKIKNYIMDIEEKIFSIENLEDKVSESEDISEVNSFVVEKLGLTTSFDINIVNDVVSGVWNDFWGNYI